MKAKIWRILTEILCYRSNLVNILKPFLENLNDNDINDDQYIPLLKTFSEYQLEVLYKNEIIKGAKLKSLLPNNVEIQKEFEKEITLMDEDEEEEKVITFTLPQSKTSEEHVLLLKKLFMNDNVRSLPTEDDIKKIIIGDNLNELQKIIKDNDMSNFNTITESFNEVKSVKIPIIQYSILKKARSCFKFLLVNGYDDPTKALKENSQYEWDCIATAIYIGDIEVVKILEEKGLQKGMNPSHTEAAILSYRNEIGKEIIEEAKEKNQQIEELLNKGLLVSSKNNNINGAKMLIKYGANLNMKNTRSNSIIKTKHHFTLQSKQIQKS